MENPYGILKANTGNLEIKEDNSPNVAVAVGIQILKLLIS